VIELAHETESDSVRGGRLAQRTGTIRKRERSDEELNSHDATNDVASLSWSEDRLQKLYGTRSHVLPSPKVDLDHVLC